MKFKTLAKMRSNPDFKIGANLEPIGFSTSVEGSAAGTVGAVEAHVGEVPIRMAIPFLKRRRYLTPVASVGGFTLGLQPIDLKLDLARMQCEGLFGVKGIRGSLESKVKCETDMEMSGSIHGKVGSLVLKLGDEE